MTNNFPMTPFNTIHVVWIGSPNATVEASIATWRQMNPSWNIRVWTNDDLVGGTWHNRRLMAVLFAFGKPAYCGIADLMRYEILWRHGGFAIDADTTCIRPLENWLFHNNGFASWANEKATPYLVNNAFVYVPPQHPLMRHLIDAMAQITTWPENAQCWEVTGPLPFSRMVGQLKLQSSNFVIHPSHYFSPIHCTGESYQGDGPVFAQHFWGSTVGAPYHRPYETNNNAE